MVPDGSARFPEPLGNAWFGMVPSYIGGTTTGTIAVELLITTVVWEPYLGTMISCSSGTKE